MSWNFEDTTNSSENQEELVYSPPPETAVEAIFVGDVRRGFWDTKTPRFSYRTTLWDLRSSDQRP